MKPAPFRYLAPRSVEETLAMLAEHGDECKLLAGGQSLVPMMNFRLATPSILVDLNRVQQLDTIRQDGGLVLGAMTRQRRLERDPEVARCAPLVAETMPYVAHPQIRNRGTLGGSLAHADPAAELPAVMLALGARLRVRNSKREREIAAGDFFVGVMTTALQADELLVQVSIPPLPSRAGWSFQEIARRHGDYALVGAATLLTLDERDRCCDVRIVLMGLGTKPVMLERAALLLIGNEPTPEAIQAVARAADREIDPPTDIHASAEFRRSLARTLVRRTLETAVRRAQVSLAPRQGAAA